MIGVGLNAEKLTAFINRGYLTWVSYKAAMVFHICHWFLELAWAFYFARIVQPGILLVKYGSDYFSFVLLGMITERYLFSSLWSFMNTIKEEQSQGTLEMALLSPTKLYVFVICQGLWAYVLTTFFVAIIVILGLTVFGGHFLPQPGQWLLALVILSLLLIAMAGFGLMAAGVIMLTKQGDPITFLIAWVNMLFCGTYYPIEILPVSLQYISRVLPLTYGLEGMRLVLLKGYTLEHPIIQLDLLALVIFSLILVPLGLRVFRWGFNATRKEGTLAFY